MLGKTNGAKRMSERLKQTAVRFEPELHEKLQQLADKEGRPLANLIRRICHEATAKQESTHHAA
jgi:predicted DNA-binding protein